MLLHAYTCCKKMKESRRHLPPLETDILVLSKSFVQIAEMEDICIPDVHLKNPNKCKREQCQTYCMEDILAHKITSLVSFLIF